MNVPLVTHRYTSNSRGPGQKGTPVAIEVGKVTDCLKCGGKRYGTGPHAPHYASDGRGLVDCVGAPVLIAEERP